MGFSLSDQVLEKACFPGLTQVDHTEYLFFNGIMGKKAETCQKKKSQSHNSNLPLAHFYIACLVSSV